MNEEWRDELARIIDPKAWELYEHAGWATQPDTNREPVVAASRTLANKIIESGLMAAHEWDRLEYQRARDRIIQHTSRTGKCYSVDDILDGYFMHDPKCVRWPDGAIGGTNCIH